MYVLCWYVGMNAGLIERVDVRYEKVHVRYSSGLSWIQCLAKNFVEGFYDQLVEVDNWVKRGG